QRRPHQARRTKYRRRRGFWVEDAVQRAAQHIDEEAQAEHAVNNGRYTGEVVHRDADDARQSALLGVFAQVNRRDHAERGNDHRHDDGHQHGAEDGREDAALGVGLARLVADEFPDLGTIEAELLRHRHGIRLVGAHHFAETDFQLAAIDGAHTDAVAVEGLMQLHQPAFQLLVLGIPLGALGVQLGLGGSIQFVFQLQLARLQAQPFQAVVDAPDITLFQLADLPVQLVDTLNSALQLWPGGLAFGDQTAALLDVEQLPVEVAPFAALQHDQVRGRALIAQPLAHHPGEVRAINLTVAHLEQLAGHELAALGGNRQAAGRKARTGHFLGLHTLAGQQAELAARHLIVGNDDIGRPEVRHAANRDY